MIDYHGTLKSVLSNILPTYYELNLTKECSVPCISYRLKNDDVEANGDTIGYAGIQYYIKVWSTDIADLQKYSQIIDKTLRPMGFTRISTDELYDRNSAMKQKILVYSARYLEEFEYFGGN